VVHRAEVQHHAVAGGLAIEFALVPAGQVEAPEIRLEKLKGLFDKGLISQADYDTAKAELLKKLIG
ncbi:MAG: SHOCT domain-containing protein, partial [Candidatus Methylophosphatis roskildensis]